MGNGSQSGKKPMLIPDYISHLCNGPEDDERELISWGNSRLVLTGPKSKKRPDKITYPE